MFQLTGPNENDVLTVKPQGRVTKADYDEFLPQLESMLETQGKLRFFIDLNEFTGIEPSAVWQDIKFDVEHRNRYGRTSIVGTDRWAAIAARLSGLLFGAEVKYFDEAKRDEAWRWVNES